MYGEERELWEKSVLRRTVDFSDIQLDPTPFQIQESTSLFKLRNAIESVQSGKTPTRREGECQPEESPDLIGDDVDYLHPQLEVLTRPNTCADISDIFNGSQECLVDRPSIPVIEMNGQRTLPTSASAPYLSHEEDDGNTSSNKLATSPRFTLENQSTISSVNSHKDDFSDDNPERSGHQRRSTMPSTLPDVRIVMPDDDKQESI
ncbi:hypothetical protein OESDEN_14342 [Oesophagostomum dentatum]|uniref:Uncharacterized protein n=1 Tax=Oesophagostomum dentatum TaxID=61180 RepID=A0A0B1SPU3_OESDE|nr:hypothetical protein OESDEN_14342 [Oesophagostomum dentatum]